MKGLSGYCLLATSFVGKLISSDLWEILAITNRRHIAQSASVRNFRHIGTSTNFKSDWEPGLREATAQALYREHNSDPNLRKLLQDAPLLGKQDKATPFGDIAVLARGQLYSNFGGYVFVQDPYQNDCDDCHNINTRCGRIHCEIWKPRNNEQLAALWTIKRIRHRDFHGNHRYEVEYTISPIKTLIKQPFVTKEGRFDYAVPGHVFILRNHHASVPQNHNSFDYKPGTLLVHGNKPLGNGFEHTSPKYPTTEPNYLTTESKYSTTESVGANDKEIDFFNALLESLDQQTSTASKINTASSTANVSTKPTPSTTTTIVDEIPKTTLVELPTGQLVPITDITTPFIRESTSGYVSVRFPTTPLTTQRSTRPSIPTTGKGSSKSTIPMKPKTTFHYFSATEEEATTESAPKTTIPMQKTSPATYTKNTMFIILEESPTPHAVTQTPLESTRNEIKSTQPQKSTRKTTLTRVSPSLSSSTTPLSTSKLTPKVSPTTAHLSTKKMTSKISTTVTPKSILTKRITKMPRTTKKRYTRIKQSTKKAKTTSPMPRTSFKYTTPTLISKNAPSIITTLQQKTTVTSPKTSTIITKEEETTHHEVTKELTLPTVFVTTSASTTKEITRPIVNTYSEKLTTISTDKMFTTIPIESTVETTESTLLNTRKTLGSTLHSSTTVLQNTESTLSTSSKPTTGLTTILEYSDSTLPTSTSTLKDVKIGSTGVVENTASKLPISRSTFKEPKTIMTTEMASKTVLTTKEGPHTDTEATKSTIVYTEKTTQKPTTHIQKITKSNFLENDDKNSRKDVYPIYSKVDFSEDDIFGTTLPSSTKPTSTNTTKRRKVTKSDVEIALFGNNNDDVNTNTRRSKSLKIKPTQEITTHTTSPSTKIIYSNFYEPSTTAAMTISSQISTITTEKHLNNVATTMEEALTTSQSYLGSSSLNVNNNNSTEIIERTTEAFRRNDINVIETTERAKTDKDPEVTFDHVAMMVLNHARSIDYLSKSSKLSAKYKRRRHYTPRSKRPTKTRKPTTS